MVVMEREESAAGGVDPEAVRLELERLRLLARRHAEILSARSANTTERLLAITGALADAVTPNQVFLAVVDQAGSILGGASTALWLVDARQTGATLVRSIGYAKAARAKGGKIPFDRLARTPVLDAVESGQAIWIESRAELLERYPRLAEEALEDRFSSMVCLPMTIDGGRTIGVLALTFDERPPPTAEERALSLVVARYCAQALERIRLLQAEQAARDRAERAQAETALLYRLSDAVNAASSLDAVYEIALDTIEKALEVERAAVLFFDDDGVMRFKAWRGLSAGYRAAVEGHSPWTRADANPSPIFVPDVRAYPALADYAALLEQEQIQALAFVPLCYQSHLLGKLMLYWRKPRAFEKRQIEIARSIADQVSSGVGWRMDRREKERLIDDLTETVRLNELLAGVVGHDLRNPLGAILTSAQLALRRSKGQPVVPQLQRILSCGGRMTRLIDQLLDFTRVRAGGGIPCDPKETHLGLLCRHVIDELSSQYPLRQITVETSGDLEGCWDPDRLAQVVSNLANNAIRHGEPDAPVSVRIEGDRPAEITLRIANRGVISPDILSHIFQPFLGTQTKSYASQGLGLGLYITQQIILAHAGTVAVSSVEGEGTAFAVTLPRRIAASQPLRRKGPH
jgi:signal transduction histidine kinase